MGRNNSKTIAVIALMVAIVGLSLGFAALNSTLTITSKATVTVPDAAWKVGLSNVNNDIPTDSPTVTGSNSNGSLTLAANAMSIAQTTNANASLETNESGSSVTYDFFVVNKGDLDAYLNNIQIGSLTCTRVSDSTTINSTDCAAMFHATLTIGSSTNAITVDSNGTTQVNSNIGDKNKLVKKSGTTYSYVPVTLTIAYIPGGVNAVTNTTVDESFYVELGTSTIFYTPRSTGTTS